MSDSTNPKDALGVRKAPLRFVPPALVIVASGPMADGAAKYGPYNWRKTSVRLTVYLEAIERHVLALRDGQDRAEDSGELHVGHIAACCGIIADAAALGMLIDDRECAGPAPDMLRERDKTTGNIELETERDGAVVGALDAPASAPFSPGELPASFYAHVIQLMTPDRATEYLIGERMAGRCGINEARAAYEHVFGALPGYPYAQSFSPLDPKADPPVNESAVADSEGDVKPRAVYKIGDMVRVLANSAGVRAGCLGFVREVRHDFLNVELPGVRSDAPDGLWRFLNDEIEVLT